MTATARFSRVAVAVALGVTAPLVLRAETAPPVRAELATPGARLTHPESAATGPARHGHQPVADTSAKREHGKSERTPAATRRKAPKAKSGTTTSPQSTPSAGQYVPDQPWETEFFVSNRDLAPRGPFVRFASVSGN